MYNTKKNSSRIPTGAEKRNRLLHTISSDLSRSKSCA